MSDEFFGVEDVLIALEVVCNGVRESNRGLFVVLSILVDKVKTKNDLSCSDISAGLRYLCECDQDAGREFCLYLLAEKIESLG